MSVTDEAHGAYPTAAKLADLDAELRSISPEILAGDAEAIKRSKKIRQQIADLEEERRLRRLAEEEEQRRAVEAAAKRDLEMREQARQQFVTELDAFVEVEAKLSQLVDDLLATCKDYKARSHRLYGLARKAATRGIGADREGFARLLEDFLRAKLRDVIPGVKGDGAKAVALDKQHEKWAERARESLKTPLEPRSAKEQPKPRDPEPVEAVWFTPPPVRNSEGEWVPQSVLVTHDGAVRPVSNPGMKETAEARSYYIGGHFEIVKPEDVSLLVKAGYALKKGVILPTGMYQVHETLTKEEANVPAQ